MLDSIWIGSGKRAASEPNRGCRVRKPIQTRCEFVKNLSSGAAAAANSLHVNRGRPRNLAAFLVIRDIACIFQWVTGTEASRSVDRAHGKEIGPFWQFASAVWPVVFGKGDDGLSSAMQNWARDKDLYGPGSALIANIALRHPTWGIFEV